MNKFTIKTLLTALLLFAAVFSFNKSDAQKIAAGNSHSLFICKDSTIKACGNNSKGQLGDGTLYNRIIPIQVIGLSSVIAVSAGTYFSIALKKDGTVWTWGDNSSGQLGDGTTVSFKTIPVQVKGLKNIIAIVAGSTHSLALKNDGTVWAWGSNNYGQLGNGTITSSNTIVQVAGLKDMIAITAGWSHSLALKNDSTILAWGNNSNGQLGDGTNNNSNIPIKINSISSIKAIKASSGNTMALKNDGSVWSWGNNTYGQLGDSTTTSQKYPIKAHVLNNIIAINVNLSSLPLALKNDGTVWSMGSWVCCALSAPKIINGLTNIIEIVVGNGTNFALKNDGTVYAWGNNEFGTYGDGTTTSSSIPILVKGLCTITSGSFGYVGADVAICKGNYVTLRGHDGISYKWSNGATTDSIVVSPASTTSYFCTITNAKGVKVDDIVVNVNTQAPIADAGANQTICMGQNATLTASGGFSYLWNNNYQDATITVNPNITTTYAVTVSNGCGSATDNLSVTINPTTPVSISYKADTFSWTGYRWIPGRTYGPQSTICFPINVSGLSGNYFIIELRDIQINYNINKLKLYLIGPDSSIIALSDENNSYNKSLNFSDNANVSITNSSSPYIGIYKPIESLKKFSNINPNGTWYLKITNYCDNDCGYGYILTKWGLKISSNAIKNSPGQNTTIKANGSGPFLWSNGETTASITVNPTITTTYTVSTTNSYGCVSTDNIIVKMDTVPLIANSTINQTICYGKYITFVTHGGVNYKWSNGETTDRITVKPTTNTTYICTITTANQAKIIDTAIVNVTPIAIVDAGLNQTICDGTSAILTATGIGSFKWNNGATTASITAYSYYTTTYKITATNSCGSVKDSVIVTIDKPVEAGANKIANAGQTVTLTASGNGSFKWNTGDTTASINTSITKNSTYTVSLTNVGCGTTTDEVRVSLPSLSQYQCASGINLISGEFEKHAFNVNQYNNLKVICDYLSYSYDNGCVSNSSIINKIDFGDGIITNANMNNRSHTYKKSGYYAITYYASKFYYCYCFPPTRCEGSILPTEYYSASFVIYVGNSYCLINNFTFQNESTNCESKTFKFNAHNQASSYTWDFGDGNIVNTYDSIITHTYTKIANYKVSLWMPQVLGVNDVNLIDSIILLPKADAGADKTICSGGIFSLTASGGTKYLWEDGNTNATFTGELFTSKTFYVTVTNSCGYSAKDSVRVTVNKPIADAGADKTICSGSSFSLTASGGTTYLWGNGKTDKTMYGGLISSRTFYVTVTDNNNCSAKDSVKVTVETCSNIKENVSYNSLKIYPNPARNIIIIETKGQENQKELYIYNVLGEIIRKENAVGEINQINISQFPLGIYYLRIASGSRVYNSKFVKE